MQRTMNDGCEQTFLFDSDDSHEPHDERECTAKLINDLRSTIDEYSHRLSTLQLENESLLHQLTVIEEQNGEYLLRHQNAERDLCALKQQLKRDSEEKEETIAELEQSLKNCEENKRSVDRQLYDLKDENATLLYEIEKFKDKCNDCELTVKEVEARETKLLQQLNETQEVLKNEVEQNARLTTALQETGDIVKQKDDELRTMVNKLDDMKREMTEKDNEMTAMKQVLQLVDVVEEVDEDSSNGTVETDEAVDCNVYSDEFSSLESNRSGDTCFTPRVRYTSTAIDSNKQRRRRRKVIVKRKKQKSFWDELQSEHPEVIYALPSLNRDRDSTFDEASVENSSDFIDSFCEPKAAASETRTALPMFTEAEASTLLGTASGQALTLLDLLAKDSLKIARCLCCEAKRRIESVTTNKDIGTNTDTEIEMDSSISLKENEENYANSELLPKVVVECEQENEDMHCIDNDELIASHELDLVSNYEQQTSVDDLLLNNLSLDIDTDIDFKELSKEEIESKYAALALAFNTDKSTIKQRLELQAHHREVAEDDAGKELYLMRDSINVLNQVLCSLLNDSHTDDIRSSIYELFPQIHQNVEIVQRCLNAISSRSELLGSIKEELRLSRAFELILLHVENLKRERDKERFKLKEARKLLINASQSAHKSATRSESFAAFDQQSIDEQTDDDAFVMQRYQRSISVAIPTRTLNAFRVRRASDASALMHSQNRDRQSNQSSNMSSIVNRNNIPSEMEVSYNYVESASIGTQTDEDTIWSQRSQQPAQPPSLTLPAMIALLFVVFGLFVDTNIPPFWSWEDMFRKISERIVSKEKVSKCQ